jgi:uncharacterized membrane protein (UPF0182 family)
VFFIGEDVWNIPAEQRTQEQPIELHYVTMDCPTTGRREHRVFVLDHAVHPGTGTTVAWLPGARRGHFGKLRAYRFPTEDGPAPRRSRRASTRTRISQQITEPDRPVVRGTC